LLRKFFFPKQGRKSLGLALGGGVARGIAHVGVIKALCHHRISIDYIAGVSSGAIVGGLFSAGLSIDEMEYGLSHLSWKNLAGFHFSKKSLVSSDELGRFITRFVGDVTIGELKVPFCALATDLVTGDSVPLSEPGLALELVLRASCAFPGIYPPVSVGNMVLVDGGASQNVPSKQVRVMGADVVIAIDVIPKTVLNEVPANLVLIVDRGLDLLLRRSGDISAEDADLVLTPVGSDISSFDLGRARDLIDLGFRSVDDRVDEIREILEIKK